jgi:hypothetical protein
MIFVVMEEVYSIAADGSERALVRRSQKPWFSGDRKAAHSFAKGRAAEFDAADYHADGGDPYFSGRDVVKGEAHRFIVKPLRQLERRGLSSVGSLNRWPREDGAFANLAFLFSRNNLPLLRQPQKLSPV